MAGKTPATSGSASARKATANTEIVLGAAAQQINKAVTELFNATTSLTKLTSQSDELTLLVANKEEAIRGLEVEFSERERQLRVDLDLNFRSNTEKVVNTYLASIDCTSIPTSELEALRQELAMAISNTESTVKTSVAMAVGTIKTQYESEIKLLHSENKAIAAENAARIETLTSQNTFLQGQVDKLYEQLNSERAAGISRAQAGSVGTINVSSPSK